MSPAAVYGGGTGIHGGGDAWSDFGPPIAVNGLSNTGGGGGGGVEGGAGSTGGGGGSGLVVVKYVFE